MKHAKKYKQTEIPEILIKERVNLSQWSRKYYEENIQNKVAKNRCLGIQVKFSSLGKGKVSYGGAKYAKKTSLVECLPKLLEVAEYNNFGHRKNTDLSTVWGYLNFKAKVKINGKTEHVRLSVVWKTTGFLYYNHEVNEHEKRPMRVVS